MLNQKEAFNFIVPTYLELIYLYIYIYSLQNLL